VDARKCLKSCLPILAPYPIAVVHSAVAVRVCRIMSHRLCTNNLKIISFKYIFNFSQNLDNLEWIVLQAPLLRAIFMFFTLFEMTENGVATVWYVLENLIIYHFFLKNTNI
jgi:hypothetical protein